MNRRRFLKTAGLTAILGPITARSSAETSIEPTAAKLPRWRGFNLTEKVYGRGNKSYVEADFALLAEWGFDFVRLPLSYHCWSSPDDWRQLREPVLKEIDQAIEFGKQHRIHVNLCLHRAPGYCVNPPAEPMNLWKDEKALDACAYHWDHFAARYKGVPNSRLSFNLLNEPANVSEETYVGVARRLVETIRPRDPGRLIIADGLEYGRKPVHGLVDLKIAQSTRGYDPMPVTHYKANWVGGANNWAEPTWPLPDGQKPPWDKARIQREFIKPWQELEKKGVGIHVGEWGCHQHTPHPVVLSWMRDVMELWKEAGWGWALWNLSGNFGVFNSNRTDVKYESFRGRKLDRVMLDQLRAG